MQLGPMHVWPSLAISIVVLARPPKQATLACLTHTCTACSPLAPRRQAMHSPLRSTRRSTVPQGPPRLRPRVGARPTMPACTRPTSTPGGGGAHAHRRACVQAAADGRQGQGCPTVCSAAAAGVAGGAGVPSASGGTVTTAAHWPGASPWGRSTAPGGVAVAQRAPPAAGTLTSSYCCRSAHARAGSHAHSTHCRPSPRSRTPPPRAPGRSLILPPWRSSTRSSGRTSRPDKVGMGGCRGGRGGVGKRVCCGGRRRGRQGTGTATPPPRGLTLPGHPRPSP